MEKVAEYLVWGVFIWTGISLTRGLFKALKSNKDGGPHV